MRSLLHVLLAALPLLALHGGENGEILAVLGPDRLAIHYHNIPVIVRLAEIEVPPEMADAAQAQLAGLTGKRSLISWSPELGADNGGAPRVYVTLTEDGVRSLNEMLVATGLARVALLGQGGRQRERLLVAEAAAKKAKAGLWAQASSAPVADAAAQRADNAEKTAASASSGKASKPPGPFCAEADGKYYYPSDAPEVARLNSKRLVYYANEAAARKAGKTAWQATLSQAAGGTLEDARAALARGKELMQQAVGKPPTPERDALYERAYLELSGAMQIYQRLVEASPNHEGLAEEMRECNQMRYGAMKAHRVK
ncbi:MAG: thermonuclease family protein [Burkholderiaceae bacterium]|nr:thermonuclease family protein [Burkholderiaceae bacterium]